jgi:GAF domain-containing protein
VARQPISPFVSALEALTSFHVSEKNFGDTLTHLAGLAVEWTPAAMAGITLNIGGKDATAVFTDADAPDIDSTQYETGVGPCLDAFRHGTVYRMEDARGEERWPEFASACVDHGILSTMSLPMVGRSGALGALNLYAETAGVFRKDDEDTGLVFARAAATILANAEAYWEVHNLAENLAKALESRAVIEQAKGILMARSVGLTPDGAFELLRTASQRENVKLRLIAERIVARKIPDAPG